MKTRTNSQIQPLEARQFMTVVPTLVVTQVAAGTGTQLKIQGTTANDEIHVTQSGNAFTVTSAKGFNQTFTGTFNSLKIKGDAGNDKIIVDASVTLPVYVYGDAGNDTLGGGSCDDFLYGGAGNDSLIGNAGRDNLIDVGGGSADTLVGGTGEDFFWLDSNTTEKITDADSYENATSVDRIAAFETEKFVTGATKSVAVSKELSGQRIRDPDLSSTSFAYKAFSNIPLFSSSGPSRNDVAQGQIGDCFYLSTLAATAGTKPDAIRDSITDLGDGTYAVRFKTSTGLSKFYRVDNDLPVYKNSSTLAYARLGAESSVWVAVAEKAYAHFRRSQSTYNSINGGWMGEAFTTLGLNSQSSLWKNQATSGDDYLNWVQQQLDAGYTVTMGVINPPGQLNLIGGHAYTVVGVQTNDDGTRSLIVRNPWGVDGYRTTDGAQDGYVTLSAADAFSGIDAFVAAKAA